MATLLPADLESWRLRFSSFDDAVIRTWSADFGRGLKEVVITIEAQDRDSPSGWSMVTLRLSGVSSMAICDGPKMSFLVLYSGLHVLVEGDSISLEFGNFLEAPDSVSDLLTSPCHVSAKSLEWHARAIS